MCFEIRKLNSKYLASSAQRGLISNEMVRVLHGVLRKCNRDFKYKQNDGNEAKLQIIYSIKCQYYAMLK